MQILLFIFGHLNNLENKFLGIGIYLAKNILGIGVGWEKLFWEILFWEQYLPTRFAVFVCIYRTSR